MPLTTPLWQLNIGLREVRRTAKEAEEQGAKALKEADYWRSRAASTREAVALVMSVEGAQRELEEARELSIEDRFAMLLNKQQSKDTETMARWEPKTSDQPQKRTKVHLIDVTEFTSAFLKLMSDHAGQARPGQPDLSLTADELEQLYRRCDTSEKGEVRRL